jgi:hypothetical protein
MRSFESTCRQLGRAVGRRALAAAAWTAVCVGTAPALLAQNQVFLQPVHVLTGSDGNGVLPSLRLTLDPASGGNADWTIESSKSTNSGGFRIFPSGQPNGRHFFLRDNGNLCLSGTAIPCPTRLYVEQRDLDPAVPLVAISSFSNTVVGRNLLRLSNNGPATFRFENINAVTGGQAGAIWSFGQRALGNQFFIATNGAPGLNLTLDPNGNMTIAGALTQMSDRNSKHEIAAVDGQDVLARVAALPVTTWQYKGDEARHIGPMAQDFAAAFGLGNDDTHIAPSDVAGVSLVAVQALQRENQELRAGLASLREELRGALAELRAAR